jgi:hypothetical protein
MATPDGTQLFTSDGVTDKHRSIQFERVEDCDNVIA